MIGILTSVIGIVAKGKSAKAIGAAIPGVLMGVLAGPEMMEAFGAGFAQSATPAATLLGQALGGIVVGAVNFAFAWLAPKNAE